MKDWERFKTFKERGEWVELQFMANAALHGYHVLKPCGETLEYDVGIESEGGLLRVQVKSSTARNGTGYLCQFRRNYLVEEQGEESASSAVLLSVTLSSRPERSESERSGGTLCSSAPQKRMPLAPILRRLNVHTDQLQLSAQPWKSGALSAA